MIVYKKYFFQSFSIIFLFLATVLMINYYVDPGNQFFRSQSLEVRIATKLLAQQEVMIHTNYNERALQKIMLESLTKCPEILVLGSSRVMQISAKEFANENFYNAAVSSASLEDDIALYYIFQKKGWQPKTLVLGVDPWIVSQFNNSGFWKINLAPEFNEGKKLIFGESNSANYARLEGFSEKYLQLLSLNYLKASFKRLHDLHIASQNKNKWNDIVVPPDNRYCPTCYIRRPDGGRVMSKKEESTTAQEADQTVQDMIKDASLNLRDHPELDTEYIDLFEHFVRYLLKHHINIILFFPPLEPKAYTELMVNNPTHWTDTIAEKYFLSIASKYKLKILGSYNPARLNLNEQDFIDYWHLKGEGVRKIFNKQYIA